MSFVLQAPRPVAATGLQWRGKHEFALVATACIAYLVACATAPIRPHVARENARAILAFERRWGLDIEHGLNIWLAQQHLLADVVTTFYTASFFVVTVATLIVIWKRARHSYSPIRNSLFLMTGGAAVTYWTYPVAPPRLLSEAGYVDTVASANASGNAYSAFTAAFANEYGAMPSMHTGWSVWVALVLGFTVFTAWWQRLLLALYPATTIWVIMATANHFILDAVVGIAYCLCALVLIREIRRRRS